MSSPRRGGAAGAGSENPSKKKGGRIVGTVRPFRVDLEDRSKRVRLRRPYRLEDARHGTGGDFGGLAAREPHRPGLLSEGLFEDRDEVLPVHDARRVRGEAGIREELRPPEDPFTEDLELPVRSDREQEPPVRRLERAIRLDRGVGVAVACGLPPRHERRAPDVDERREARRDEVRLHVRALSVARAGVERREDLREGRPAREDVDERDADLVRRAVGRPRDRHEARRALGEEVEPRLARLGPHVSRTRDRADDEARVLRAKRVHPDAALLERARQEILDEDVGPRRPPAHELPSVRRPEVHGRRFLPPVHGEEVGRLPVERGRLPAARDVAAPGILHLDDARAEVREEHRRERPREDAREVEDDDAVQRWFTHQNRGRLTTRIVVSSAGVPSPTCRRQSAKSASTIASAGRRQRLATVRTSRGRS